MSEELVKRLRDSFVYDQQHYAPDPLVAEAADRIEALTAAGDALAKVVGGHTDDCGAWWEDSHTCTCGYTQAINNWVKVRGHD